MSLFTAPATARAFPTPAPHRETLAQRLARAASPADRRVRELLERWFSRLPSDAQADVRSRFWERDRRLALAAFWELYLHELLSRLGYALALHPRLRDGSRRPDFRAERGTDLFYLEALVHGPPSETWRAERRLYPILDVLHAVAREPFSIVLDDVEPGPGTPPLRELRDALQTWLASLDPLSDVGRTLAWHRAGWRLVVRATTAGDACGHPALTNHALSAGTSSSRRALTNKLQAKARRYHGLDAPLLLALCTTEPLPLETVQDVAASLSFLFPEPLAGLLVAPGLSPWEIARTPLWLFTSPSSEPLCGLRQALWAVGAQPTDEAWLAIAHPWPIFGLWPEWPDDPR